MVAADAGIASPRASLARSSLALAAAAAVMYLWLASMWLTFAAAAATEIGRVASCRPMVDAVSKVNDAAFISFALLSPVANLLLAFRKVDSPRDKAVKELAMESTAEVIAEAMREMLRNTLVRGLFVTMAFIQLKLLVDLWGSCVKGSHWERICSVVRVIGAVGADATYCFVIIPYIAQMWRKKQPLFDSIIELHQVYTLTC
nr:uncharacterized protein LOC117860347 isoform X2 [Setaria viridis]